MDGNGSAPAGALELRYYQREAIDAAYEHIRNRNDNPCIVLPTGSGKTAVMATLCNDVVTQWNGRVLVLSHVKELIEQTAATLQAWYPSLKVGVYSAGLGRRETHADVLVAGIQSVHKKGLKLAGSNPFKAVLVDEAHRIPTSGDGMYRNLLNDLLIASPKTRVIGLTATPYRLKGGLICGPDNFLNAICYEAGVRELIAKGYLCPLTSKQASESIDDSQLRIKGGEFDAPSLSLAFDDHSVVDRACWEISNLTKDRRSVLVFCCDVAHAEHVAGMIHHHTGHICGIVTGETAKGERDATIGNFKSGRLKYLCNVNVLTEGFDHRGVDCVVLLRSTLSPGLYYQMVGRGLRTLESKTDCMVLDFGGNVLRHGCIDDINVKTGKVGTGEPLTRVCPECKELVALSYSICPACDFVFPVREDRGPNHEATADTVPITTDQVKPIEHTITEVSYTEHIKQGADENTPKTMRVSYYEGMRIVCEEWVCVEHVGFAGDKAANWWMDRCDEPMPTTALEASRLGGLGYLAEPVKIAYITKPGERFKTIVKYWLGDKPDAGGIVTTVDEWGDEVRGAVYLDEDIPF